MMIKIKIQYAIIKKSNKSREKSVVQKCPKIGQHAYIRKRIDQFKSMISDLTPK